MSKIKALVHIGGGPLQLDSIRWAKELGLFVVVTDQNPDSPGKSIADRFELISGTDVAGLLKLSRTLDNEYQLVGAHSSSDFGLPAVAEIAEEFQRAGCSRKSVDIALDKFASKEIWRTEKLPISSGIVVSDYLSLASAVRNLGLPVIIKPIDSSGSQGVKSIWSIDELEDAYSHAKLYSSSILVEKFVCGNHIDVNGLFMDDKFYHCGTMDRFFSEYPNHYPIWGCQPSVLTKIQESCIYSIVEQAARAIEINAGPVKADIVWTDEGPKILELTPRFHGDVSTVHITPMATGLNPIKAWLAYLAQEGNPCDYLNKQKLQYSGWMAIFPKRSGDIISITGIEDAKKIKGIQEITIIKKVGDVVKSPEDNSSVCGFIWAIGSSKKELFNILTQARSTLCLNLSESHDG